MRKFLSKQKTLFTILLIAAMNFCFVEGAAQSLFYHNNCNVHPAYGDSLTGTEIDYDTTGVVPGAGGMGVVWTFSSLTTTTTVPTATELYLNPSTTTYGSNFPSSNMASVAPSAGNSYKYYKFSTDSVTQLGAYTGATNCNYPVWDPFKYTVCPFNYGDTYTDHYNSHNCGVSTYSHS